MVDSTEFKKRAKELVSKMTLEEKVYQTLHGAPALPHLGVKAYNYWNEALHGVARAGTATVFPQAIGLAATFDEDFIEEISTAISDEGRGKFNAQQKYSDFDIYKGLTFWSPNVNIFRDPRWGRGHETFGEDPYLTSRLGVRFIEGLQGHDDTYMKAAACAKHFAVHSGPEAVRHSFNAECSEQDLRETYLPAFKACVKEADVEVVMGAYNRTNGEPCCGSERLLVDILRGEWEFDGHVTSDCWAIKDFHEGHMVTSTPVESVALAMNMGCDLNCGNIYGNLLKAVEDGLVTEETITRAVERLFTTRMKLGLFDEQEKVPYNVINYDVVDCKKHQKLNEEAAKKSVVLLKNKENLLPLNKDKLKTIGVIGPNANSRNALVGNYEGTASEYITVLEGIQRYVGDDTRVLYSEGCHLYKDRTSGLTMANDRMSEVKAVADASDVVVAVMGLDATLEGEEGDTGNEYGSGDKPNLDLPGLQEEVLEACVASGKPVILVVLSGSAMAVTWADEHVDAILQGWYPGARGGKAIAEMLFGECCPEGKLPVTFYRSLEDLPDFEDYSMKGRTYRYMDFKPLYSFGYGLSYTNFICEDTKVSAEKIDVNQDIICQTTIKNQGKYDSAETIQIYVRYEGKDAPCYQLKALKKVSVKAGESKKVQLSLSPEAFGLYNEKGVKILNQGTYKVYIGMNLPDERSIELTGKKPAEFTLTHTGEDTVIPE